MPGDMLPVDCSRENNAVSSTSSCLIFHVKLHFVFYIRLLVKKTGEFGKIRQILNIFRYRCCPAGSPALIVDKFLTGKALMTTL